MPAPAIAHTEDAAAAATAFAARVESAAPALFPSSEAALAAVKADAAAFAVLAVEDAAGGTSHAAYDLMLKYQLVVVGEHVAGGERAAAAATRYLLLSKQARSPPDLAVCAVKTSLVFAFSEGDKGGQLHRALGVFASRGISLAKVESRPWSAEAAAAVGAGAAAFLFYLDVAGHEREPRVLAALAELRELCHYVRVLGSYAPSRPGESEPIAATDASTETDAMATAYPLNPILESVPLAKYLAIYTAAKQLEAAGEPVYSLCVGEPDFPTPERVIQAGIRALEERKVQYSDMRGDPTLRGLIAEYLRKAKGVTYDPETEIQVSGGAQQPFFMALYALVRPGDKVVVPSPFWGSYEGIVKQVRAGFVKLRGKIEEDYMINPVALEETLTAHPETKVLVLCNPSNPVGTLLSAQRLEEIAAVLRKPQFHHVVVFSDEIYEQIVYQDAGEPRRVHTSFATLPGMFQRTVLINGFSKAYAMTGMRIGFVAGPRHFVHPCLLLQAQLTSTANMPGQFAAAEALREEIECLEQGRVRIAEAGVLQALDAKRQYVAKRLRAIPNMQFAYPTAAFYLFMDLSAYFQGKKAYTADREEICDVVAFCEFLLREHHVALSPGVDFGEEFGIRISYAGKMETIVRAMDGLEQTLQALSFE